MFRSVMMPASLLAMFLAVGCNGDSAETDDTDAPAACTNPAEPFPENGATGVYFRTNVEADFITADEGATLEVEGVTGTSAWRGTTLVFTPSAPLTASTTYTAKLSSSCGESSWTFTTSEVGGTLTPADLVGNTYSLDLQSGRFIQPENVGALLSQYLTAEVLVSVTTASATNIKMEGAVAAEGSSPPAQEECAPTIPFPDADFDGNPYFQVGPETTTITVSGFSVTIQDLLVSGAFAPDGSYIAGAAIAGRIDTRPLVPLLDAEATGDADMDGTVDYMDADQSAGAICDLAAGLGITCEDCGDGSTPYCLSLEVDSIGAAAVNSTITPRTEEQMCELDACADLEVCSDETLQ
jgi:hypothetical protein